MRIGSSFRAIVILVISCSISDGQIESLGRRCSSNMQTIFVCGGDELTGCCICQIGCHVFMVS